MHVSERGLFFRRSKLNVHDQNWAHQMRFTAIYEQSRSERKNFHPSYNSAASLQRFKALTQLSCSVTRNTYKVIEP